MKNRTSIKLDEPDYPAIFLAGDLFIIDLEKDILADATNFENTIPFSAMQQPAAADWCRFLYDRTTRNIYRPRVNAEAIPSTVQLLEIPDRSWLDPFRYWVGKGMKADLVPETLLRLARLTRHAKALVKVKMSEHTYFADYRNLAFLDAGNLGHTIGFEAFRENYAGDIVAQYDPSSRQIVGSNQAKVSRQVVTVVLPHFKDLDPDGWHDVEALRAEMLLHQSIHSSDNTVPLRQVLRRLRKEIQSGKAHINYQPRVKH